MERITSRANPLLTHIRRLAASGSYRRQCGEYRGLTEELLALCDGTVRIPMSPRCESLNAAVAASVLLWEAYRGEEMDACQH